MYGLDFLRLLPRTLTREIRELCVLAREIRELCVLDFSLSVAACHGQMVAF